MKNLHRGAMALALAGCSLLCAHAAPAPSRTADTSPETTRPFKELGAYYPIRLRGLDSQYTLTAGVRLDEIVTRARLRLNWSYSPALLHRLSHLRVLVNDELAATVELQKELAGQPHVRDIELNPALFSDFTRIQLQWVGHYSETCEDPAHSSLWADISPSSALLLNTRPLALANDLALLPAPFFDKRDNRKLQLTMVLPGDSSPDSRRAAATVASWFGALAAYREVRIQAQAQASDTQHSVLLVQPDNLAAAQAAGFPAAAIDGPMLAVGQAPHNASTKRLFIAGRTPAELLQAAQALVLQQVALSGPQAKVTGVSLGPARKPYDAPTLLPTDRPVKLGDLLDPAQLEVSGSQPEPVRVPVRVPPDLFTQAGQSVLLQLKYRYTPPSSWNDSVLNVEINNALLQSYRLAPRQKAQDSGLLQLDFLSDELQTQDDSLKIPGFRVGGNNELTFRFRMPSQKSGACTGVPTDAMRASIDPASTLDFSHLPHYTVMPNLVAFANGGYPFTTLADLADTAVVLPDAPTRDDESAWLTLMGHMGKWTGIPTFQVAVVPAKAVASVSDRHLLVVGTTASTGWLQSQAKTLPMVLESARRGLTWSEPARWLRQWWYSDLPFRPSPLGQAMVQSQGPLGAILGFQSPWSSQRSVVLFTGTEATTLAQAVASLEDPGKVARIRGSVTLVKGEELEGFDLGPTYVSGHLPWWLQARIALSRYPLLVAVLGVLAGLALAFFSYGWLSRLSQKRLQPK